MKKRKLTKAEHYLIKISTDDYRPFVCDEHGIFLLRDQVEDEGLCPQCDKICKLYPDYDRLKKRWKARKFI